ncbi:MAG: acyl-CoA dehydrogenase family protein [Candidatus Hodarchaeota archaeon]
MDTFPWWNEEQIEFQKKLEDFVNKNRPKTEEAYWAKRFPWDVMKEVAKAGIMGAGVPKEYGGLGLGATGSCIAAEQLGRLCVVGHIFVVSMLGGLHQLKVFGTESQKKRWLGQIAKGEKLGAVCITEIFAGSDAAAIKTSAVKEGDEWILNGKKRFITGAGPAHRYCVYAQTSDNLADIKSYKHLTAFIVEKGTPGFHLEKINSLIGIDNVPNGYLDFNNVRLTDENKIGEVGKGWEVMMSGLNFERLIGSAVMSGGIWDAACLVSHFTKRRYQFRQPTRGFVNNQFIIADMIMRSKIARMITFYTALLLDSGKEPAIESSIAKLINTNYAMETGLAGVQAIGGDGLTKFYPIERLIRDAKIGQIVAGTNEIQKLIIYRTAMFAMEKDLRLPYRLQMHPELKVPCATIDPSPFQGKEINEENILKVLAEDYRVNPGIYMTVDDIKNIIGGSRVKIREVLEKLAEQKLVVIQKDRKDKIDMAIAQYTGLRKAYPLEHYKWFPDWYAEEDMF